MRRAGVLTEAGKPANAVDYTRLALRGDELTPQLRALTHRQAATAQATMGDAAACEVSVGSALGAIANAKDDDGTGLTAYCSPAYVAMEAGTSLAKVGRIGPAVDLISKAVETWPDGQQRDKGLCLARLAEARVTADDVPGACDTALQAARVYSMAPSARTAATLRGVRNRLHRHRRVPEVRDLNEQLADVI